jgi:hypothetical protein
VGGGGHSHGEKVLDVRLILFLIRFTWEKVGGKK